jgi:hypothetical protein
MNTTHSNRPIGIWVISIVALLFGLLTLKSGGTVLFVDGPAREAAGNYVPFVLWFNFIAGFFYILAGMGLWFQQRWAAWLAEVILLATLLTFAFFAWHIYSGGLYETRTVAAMSFRSVVWCAITCYAYFRLIRH